MEYRVLGSLEVLDGSGRRVPLGGTRQQTVLGSLLLRAGRTVPLRRLVDELWETPPETAAKTVQVYVSRLRRLPATVVFADVVDSTALGEQLDPESVHRILERYSAMATEILERHGGHRQEVHGRRDRGMTELHEDDA